MKNYISFSNPTSKSPDIVVLPFFCKGRLTFFAQSLCKLILQHRNSKLVTYILSCFLTFCQSHTILNYQSNQSEFGLSLVSFQNQSSLWGEVAEESTHYRLPCPPVHMHHVQRHGGRQGPIGQTMCHGAQPRGRQHQQMHLSVLTSILIHFSCSLSFASLQTCTFSITMFPVQHPHNVLICIHLRLNINLYCKIHYSVVFWIACIHLMHQPIIYTAGIYELNIHAYSLWLQIYNLNAFTGVDMNDSPAWQF